jgi:AAA family ATP:ADP antiporter
LARGGAFKLVLGKRYLLLIALLMVILNLVNTTGEFILGKVVTQEARQAFGVPRQEAPTQTVIAPLTDEQKKQKAQEFIARFYGDYFFTVNLIGALAQLFLVSRIMSICGVPVSLFFLPLMALTGYSLISFLPTLPFIRLAKIIENSTDYSLQNTARQALFLPTTREEKYKAKAAIDTFFVRIGDVLSTGLVFLSVQLSLDVRAMSMINVALVAIWLLLVAGIGRSYRAMAAEQSKLAS